jgi:hypothetical protein
MRTLILFATLFPAAAIAAPVGAPIADPETGRLAIVGTLDTESRVLADTDCSGDDCEAARVPMGWGGRLSLNLLHGVGVFVDTASVTESIEGAGYSAAGVTQGGGVRLAVPVTRTWYLAATAQVERGNAEGTSDWDADAEGSEIDGTGSWQHARATFTAAIHPDESFTFYVGPTYSLSYTHEAEVASDATDFHFEAVTPVGAVAGFEVFSNRLTVPWSPLRTHLTLGVESRYEGGFGLGVWTGIGF